MQLYKQAHDYANYLKSMITSTTDNIRKSTRSCFYCFVCIILFYHPFILFVIPVYPMLSFRPLPLWKIRPSCLKTQFPKRKKNRSLDSVPQIIPLPFYRLITIFNTLCLSMYFPFYHSLVCRCYMYDFVTSLIKKYENEYVK